MADLDPRITALLDRAAEGDIGDAPVDDILRRGARRRRTRSGILAATAAVATAAAVSAVAVVVTSSPDGNTEPTQPVPTATTFAPTPATGVSAEALAHGHWTNVAKAPVRFCGQTSVVWTGSFVVAVTGEDSVTCASAAAAYYPKGNRWQRLDSPPPGITGQLVLASAGGRVVAVSQLRGTSAALDVASGHWQALPSLPSPSADPLSGPVATALAVGNDVIVVGVGKDGDQAFRLSGGAKTWTELSRLPHPHDHKVVATAGYFDGASPWVTVTTEKVTVHPDIHESTLRGALSAFELQDNTWFEHSGKGLPVMLDSAQALGSQTLIVGGGCLPTTGCPVPVYSPSLLLTDFRAGTVQAIPGSPLGATTQHAFSTGAAILLYDASGSQSGPDGSIRPGDTAVYDVRAGKWLQAPHSVRVEQISGEVWTPYGFVVFGQPMEKCLCNPGGLILRPARH